MAKPCAACVSPRRAEIDTALASGATAKAIAATVGLNATCVARHRRICLQPAILSDSNRVALLVLRSEELWAMAAGNQDVRGMAQSIQGSLRALEFQIRHREAEAEAETARDLPLDLRQWTTAEGTRMMKFLDSLIANTPLPSPTEYAARCGSQFQGEKHEHFDRIPIRN